MLKRMALVAIIFSITAVIGVDVFVVPHLVPAFYRIPRDLLVPATRAAWMADFWADRAFYLPLIAGGTLCIVLLGIMIRRGNKHAKTRGFYVD